MAVSDAAYIGLDVGGTFLKGARIDATGKILTRLHEPIRKARRKEILGQFAAAVEALEGRAGRASRSGWACPASWR